MPGMRTQAVRPWAAVLAAGGAAAGVVTGTVWMTNLGTPRPTAAATTTAPTSAAVSDPTSVIVATASSTDAAPSVVTPSRTVATTNVVPWADLPATSPTAAATPSDATDPQRPICVADQLAASFRDEQRGTGHTFAGIDIRRVSGPPCMFDDRAIGLSGSFDAAPRVPLTIETRQTVWDDANTSPAATDPTPVYLGSGDAVADVPLRWYPRCDDGQAQKMYAPARYTSCSRGPVHCRSPRRTG